MSSPLLNLIGLIAAAIVAIISFAWVPGLLMRPSCSNPTEWLPIVGFYCLISLVTGLTDSTMRYQYSGNFMLFIIPQNTLIGLADSGHIHLMER